MSDEREEFSRVAIKKFGPELAFEALTDIGTKHARGEGVPKDCATAIKWWSLAGTRGYAPAQVLIGRAYSRGEGITEDPDEAMKWFLMAAEHGYADAVYNIGLLYYGGVRSQTETKHALAWFMLAREMGHDVAKKAASIIEADAPAELVASAVKLAAEIAVKLKVNRSRN